ncbi:MAG: SDR family oxidoreductase [Proteobacteria bacterium]|nr:SDR family oxidoreductase [Pseudomonadota bacterium]
MPRSPQDHPSVHSLAGRHALVTGASRGIGAAIARMLAGQGARVTLIARDRHRLAPIAAELDAHAIACDVTDAIALGQAFATAAGSQHIDILVNNAGGAESAPFGRTEPDLWARMIALNLTATFTACRLAIPAMVADGWGRVVNVASTAGLKGYPYVSAYAAAKHGVVGLTRSLGMELARTGVTVNAVCPGYTDTPMLDDAAQTVAQKTHSSTSAVKQGFASANPMGRLVEPGEVASLVAYLCSDAAASITGAALPISGGEI